MKIPSATWISCVAIALVAGIVLNSADLILVALLAGTIGFGARLVIAFRDHWEGRRSLTSGETPIQDVEGRLHLAEQALASVKEEFARTRALDVADPQ